MRHGNRCTLPLRHLIALEQLYVHRVAVLYLGNPFFRLLTAKRQPSSTPWMLTQTKEGPMRHYPANGVFCTLMAARTLAEHDFAVKLHLLIVGNN